MYYLTAHQLLPEKFDPAYIILACALAGFAVKLTFTKLLPKKVTKESVTIKARGLNKILNETPEGKSLPSPLRKQLYSGYILWSTEAITDKEFDDQLNELQKSVREALLPVVRGELEP